MTTSTAPTDRRPATWYREVRRPGLLAPGYDPLDPLAGSSLGPCAHAAQTCDGVPRALPVGAHGQVLLARCGAWLHPAHDLGSIPPGGVIECALCRTGPSTPRR